MTVLSGAGSTRAGARGRRTRLVLWGAALVVLVLVAVVVLLVVRGSTPPKTWTMFGDAVPAVPSVDDPKDVELGVRFTSSSNGFVSAVRFYRGPQNLGQHVGTIWSPEGEPMARATFPDTSDTGWQQALLDAPVRLAAGATYTASYRAPQGHYAADQPSSAPPAPVTSGPLTALGGVYTYDTGAPTSSLHGAFYYVDVVFSTAEPRAVGPGGSPGSPGPSISPTTAISPTTTPSATPGLVPGRPGPTNTGVPPGTTLTAYTGPLTVTTPGTVIDGKDVRGALVVKAKDVTIRNSKIHDDPAAVAGVYVTDTGSATIVDSEIYGFQVGISYSNWTATRVDLHDLTFDGMKIGSNVRLQDSWVHNPRPTSDAHWDGGQVQAGITNTEIRGNTIDVTGGDANSALFLTPDLGPSTDGPLTVTGNWLDGGSFTIAVLDGDGGKYFISDIAITDNHFGRGSRYGPANVKVPVTWSGNVWSDSGRPVER